MAFLAPLLGLGALCALILACSPAPEPAEPHAPEPETAPVEPVAAPEPAPEPPAPEPPRIIPEPITDPLVTDAGVELIIHFEVGSPATYTARYQRPICPACTTTASGVTIGIGYDLRHQRAADILSDWAEHPDVQRLATATGIGGQQARDLARAWGDIITPYQLAFVVFQDATLVQYWRIARRSFGGEAFDALPWGARDALVSLVYNRGGSLTGRNREEMRVIARDCVPSQDVTCIASQIRQMTRIWAGSTIEHGMTRRRYAEAELALRPKEAYR